MTKESKAKLTISEPWDQSRSLEGKLEEVDSAGESKLLFLSENKKYMIFLRYKESRIDDIWSGKHVIVNIEEFSAPEGQSPFAGIGSIELIK